MNTDGRHAFERYRRTPYCGVTVNLYARCGHRERSPVHLSDDIINPPAAQQLEQGSSVNELGHSTQEQAPERIFVDEDGLLTISRYPHISQGVIIAIQPDEQSLRRMKPIEYVRSDLVNQSCAAPTEVEAHSEAGLLLCPFCGGSKIADCDDDGLFWKRCVSCGATGPETTKYSGEEGDPYTDWNTRASVSAPEVANVDCVCGHNGNAHRTETRTGAARECFSCECDQFRLALLLPKKNLG